ncbi:MAG: 2-hydroxychromene-2-carboxylate isomerase [Gammaproteobacteria bacterium]|jgi:2-hydroxychromene-2-carboxylate isomerase|nr:2-hydroxychromene-2-carboxylate isomerase [Gammaproteobacteria bacterium]
MPAVSTPATVEFYFDCSCPWSYLALGRLREAAVRTGARIGYRPVLLAGIGGKPHQVVAQDALAEVRQRYRSKDLQDWARFCGVILQDPGTGPVDSGWAQRGVIVAQRRGQQLAYIDGVFRARFVEGRDISQLAEIQVVAGHAGLDTATFTNEINAPDTLAGLQENISRLLEHGGFGTPTMLVGTDLYFGNDRMPLVEVAMARAGGMRFVMPGEHGR